MSDRIPHVVHHHRALLAVLCVCLMLTGNNANSVEMGFQGLLQLEASDNIEGANAPDEQKGTIQSLLLGIYGERRGPVVTAAFLGELDVRNTTTSDDSAADSFSQFLGAAEFRITPRSWTWYVGNVLGGVRTDDALQPIDDLVLQRRNVFVTGPAFEYEQVGISRTSARVLFVNQSQDSESLENLYSVNFKHERDLIMDSFYGIRLGNIFTDLPEGDDARLAIGAAATDEDFNRSTFAVFYQRAIGFTTLFGELGATRYDADTEALNGFNAELRLTQELGPQTSISVFAKSDLSDQTLSAIESLVQSGEAAVGIAPDTAGFFTESTVGARYSFERNDRGVDLAAGISQLDFELLSGSAQSLADANDEDRLQGFATAVWAQRLSSQLRSELSLSYETQEFDNIADNSESVLLGAQLTYSLTRSFNLLLGITHDSGSGLRTRFIEQVEDGEGIVFGVPEDIDVTETRFSIGLNWAPPSRARQDLTVELKSLLN